MLVEPNREEVDQFCGVEFDWFAQDAAGSVGLFASGGYGELPGAVIRHAACHAQVAATLHLPHLGSLQVWQDYAQYGLFVFDWKHHAGPYLKMAQPLTPLTLSLRDQVRQIPELPTLALYFRELSYVKIEPYQPRG